MTVPLATLPRRTRRPRSSRPAWVALSLTPVLGALAIYLALFVLGEGIEWWASVLVLGLAYAPPAVGGILGLRAARSGNRVGAHAVAVATAWFAFWIAFWYLANYPYNSESASAPAWLAAAAAAGAGAAVEAGYLFRTHRSHAT